MFRGMCARSRLDICGGFHPLHPRHVLRNAAMDARFGPSGGMGPSRSRRRWWFWCPPTPGSAGGVGAAQEWPPCRTAPPASQPGCCCFACRVRPANTRHLGGGRSDEKRPSSSGAAWSRWWLVLGGRKARDSSMGLAGSRQRPGGPGPRRMALVERLEPRGMGAVHGPPGAGHLRVDRRHTEGTATWTSR
jgi:hypothetical protein